MTLVKRCCWWKDLKNGCLSAALLTMVTSAIQIFVQITVFTAALEDRGLTYFMTSVHKPIYIMYLTLAVMDLILIIVSGLLLSAIERNTKGVWRMIPWMCFLPVYVVYEAAVNIYFFYSAFTARQHNAIPVITKSLGYLLVPFVYWTLKIMLNAFGFLCVLSQTQKLRRLVKDDTANKSKQSKIYYGDYTYDDGYANRYETNTYAKRHNNYLYKPIKYRKIDNKNLTAEYVKNYQTSNCLDAGDSLEYPMLDNFRMSDLPKRRAVPVSYECRMPDADYPRGLPRTPLWIHNSGIPVLTRHPMAFNSRQYLRQN